MPNLGAASAGCRERRDARAQNRDSACQLDVVGHVSPTATSTASRPPSGAEAHGVVARQARLRFGVSDGLAGGFLAQVGGVQRDATLALRAGSDTRSCSSTSSTSDGIACPGQPSISVALAW